MKRINIFIRLDQKNALDKVAADSGISYSELIRDAIDNKLLSRKIRTSRTEILKETKGILKNRFDNKTESKEIVDRFRSSWEEKNEGDKG